MIIVIAISCLFLQITATPTRLLFDRTLRDKYLGDIKNAKNTILWNIEPQNGKYSPRKVTNLIQVPAKNVPIKPISQNKDKIQAPTPHLNQKQTVISDDQSQQKTLPKQIKELSLKTVFLLVALVGGTYFLLEFLKKKKKVEATRRYLSVSGFVESGQEMEDST